MKQLAQEESEMLYESMDFLKDALLKIGVTELRISKTNKEIFFDTDEDGFDGNQIAVLHKTFLYHIGETITP